VKTRDEAIVVKGGRRLAFRTFGRAGGRPLLFFHGFPGSRLQAALVQESAEHFGVELIAPERPGFGRSEFDPHRTILGWVDDVASLAEHLGLARFGVVGVSCGGAYALACALRMPERLDYVGLVAGMGPMDIPEFRQRQMPVLKAMFALARLNPWLATPFVAMDWLLFRTAPQRAEKALAAMLAAPDRALLAANVSLRVAFAASLAEAYASGIRGALREAHLIATARGFAMEEIAMPVHVYQGGLDRHVTPEMGRHIASALPRGRLRFYPEEGHLSILVRRFDDCLRDFVQVGLATRHQQGN